MKIYLYLNNKIELFYLPKDISGSYSFDADEEEQNKLININAKDKKWYLYSTKVCNIFDGKSLVEEVELIPEQFYIICRNDSNYLIYVSETNDPTGKTYLYSQNLNLSIGMENSTIQYSCQYAGNLSFSITYQSNTNSIVLQRKNGNIYINKNIFSGDIYQIKNGDEISFYGVKVIFISKYLFIYSNRNIFSISNTTIAGLQQTEINNISSIKNIEIQDRELYGEEDYFSKSPRLRRIIEEKEIELTQPPSPDNSQEIPFLLTIGPMATMGLTSAVSLYQAINNISSGVSDISDNLPSLIMGGSMLISTLVWPIIMNKYNEKQKKKKEIETNKKYTEYLAEKREELANELKSQRDILMDNIIPLEDCLKNIENKKLNFWDKRIDQSDFLVVRVGIGNEKLKVKISYPPKGFSIDENELKEKVDDLKKEFEYIENVPIGYSLYENYVTGIMGNMQKAVYFTNNIILQLLTFYSYDDLKIVLFTNKANEKNWDYIKYLNHNATNDSSFRFFASNKEDANIVANVLLQEISARIDQIKVKEASQISSFRPYYLIIVDDIDVVKESKLLEVITEIRANIGFSLLILESKLSKLPSLCNNFINIGDNTSSGILKNSYENQEQIIFRDEINYKINMMDVAAKLANIPIEISTNDAEVGELPDAITFLEMENVGKVQQLNILNRWNTNDSTANLKAEVGLGVDGKLIYLDLHEKAHGPHGLIAGTTGSGKSEFIITWILSLCMNFSADDVSFILIDYKGGGLAFAFENKITGVRLPHLAGTITNLDKAEINRTLVSIDSEVKRRQRIFNEARDKLGESTMDIYKYQGFYHEGKLDEALPHLFIVCDEFAELKSQQPDFMDNLISVARIGRSLGVHLILATQKPSGVVNEQIWSNTKFRVCLKVQDEADSNEMLKRPDAAALKQTGRFYLQVGYDEYFVLGQSGWCGAKYYPSDVIQKTVDKSVNVIDETGQVLKNVQSGSSKQQKGEAQGEQLSAIMQEIIKTAKECNKFAKKLWLDNIPSTITIENTIEKYNFKHEKYNYNLLIGEYDAPEAQQQNPLIYNLLDDGNTNIIGTDSQENESVITSILYNILKYYSSEEISFYVMDFGSQNLVKYKKIPHCGGVVTPGDSEGFNNLIKLIQEQIKERKKILSDFGGEYTEYVKQNPGKMPIMLNIFNNYESIINDSYEFIDTFCNIIRDSERYGVVFIVTSSSINSVPDKAKQLMPYTLALKLKDPSDYPFLFNVRQSIEPRDIFGRGICKDEILHEFQTAFLCEDRLKETDCLQELFNEVEMKKYPKVIPIPTLPEQVKLENVKKKLKGLNSIPIGIEKGTLITKRLNLTTEVGKAIITSKLKYTDFFIKSIITELSSFPSNTVLFDPTKALEDQKDKVKIYANEKFDESIDKLIEFINSTKADTKLVVIIYSLNKFISKLDDSSKIEELFEKFKKNGYAHILIVEEYNKIKEYVYEEWFKSIDTSEGVHIGPGVDEQSLFKITSYSKELTIRQPKNYGYYISEGIYHIVKLIEFEKIEVMEDDED